MEDEGTIAKRARINESEQNALNQSESSSSSQPPAINSGPAQPTTDANDDIINWDPEHVFNGFFKSIPITTKQKYYDLQRFLLIVRPEIVKHLTAALKEHRGIKVWIPAVVEYEQITLEEGQRVVGNLSPEAIIINNDFESDDKLDQVFKQLDVRNENFIREKSGLRLLKVGYIQINIAHYNPLGKSWKPLPPFLRGKQAIMNVQNRDNKCFLWAVLSALHPVKKHVERVQSYKNFQNELNTDGLSFPIAKSDIWKFESQNNISINVYSFADEEGKERYLV